MQVNRLFEIVYILLNKNYITAKELAEHFEVSVRTIYRDIDVLCQSGIPIYTSKGKGGGIGLLDNFVLNKSVLSKVEQEDILSALQGLSATNYPDLDKVLNKLSNLFGTKQNNWIEVDYSDWSDNQKEKFNQIKTAVLQKKVLQFDYYSTYGERTRRETEPLQLWFKNRTWYLKAYCRAKSDIRTFKLNRMKNLNVLNDTFTREMPLDQSGMLNVTSVTNMVTIKMKISATQAYRVYDEFDENQIHKEKKDSFIVTFSFPEDEWVYGYILSFGNYAEVLEPVRIREIIKNRLQETLSIYK
ncbi:helix-turn-helix transcriptional regulator [Anaerocolumna sp. MB42-C2]|uniref:helix-turn-helix transcriptional regulator n=1 Tax=Anaerocolumna sp. MB42-C2 TaxID=3070997 RepID=UPI0027E20762|nr:YafY family protein [Anaerocolumna sp. MB42-C2]WMJ86496.1 YafY family protein [Anaerocolumna sp. MB42-C2]